MKTALIVTFLFIAAAANASTVTVAASGSIESTSGRKCIAYMGKIHCVYGDAGVISYRTSTNGTTWTSGPQVASAGSRPAIAVTSTGQIGVAYQSGGGIEYRYRTTTGWSTPTVVTNLGSEPAITAALQRVYIAWNTGDIMVADFIANAPPSTVTSVMITSPIPISTMVVRSRENIAIASLTRSSGPPLIRVAWFDQQVCNGTSSCTDFFRLTTADGPAAPPWPQSSLDNFGMFGLNVAGASGVSLAMDAESGSGDVYVLASMKHLSGSSEATTLYKQNAWSSGAYKRSQLLTKPSLGSVAAARLGCGSQFRVALTEYPLNNLTGLGATWYRGGTWDATAPAWSGGQASLGSAIWPHALFVGGSSPSFPEVRVVFGNGGGINAVTVPSNGIAIKDCISHD